MVKTLFKYEFKAYARTLLPMNGILLVIALINRLIQFMESDRTTYDIMFGFSVFALVISIVFLAAFTTIFVIVRYYKNMFSSEGYLTMTLPVTNKQHILTKLVTAVTFTLVMIVTLLLAGCIVTSGDLLVEIIKAISYIFDKFFHKLGVHGVFYIIEFVIAVLLSLCASYLLLYNCMTVGQLAKKNRVLMSFGIYFGIDILSQLLTAIVTSLFWALVDNGAFMGVIEFIDNHPFASVHILLVIFAVFAFALGLLFYFVTHYILNNKLNLE